MGIIFERERASTKKPQHLKKIVFTIYSLRTVTIEPATSTKVDTGIMLMLPNDSKSFIKSKFRGDENFEINSEKQLLWAEILNKSFLESIKIKKGSILGFAVIDPENLNFKHETPKKTKTKKRPYLKRRATGRKRKTQRGGFFNRYDFTYAGRGTVNQAAKVAPNIIKNATKDLDEMAKNRINQTVSIRGAEIERVLP